MSETLKQGEIHSDEYGVTIRWRSESHSLHFEAKEGTRQPDGSICYWDGSAQHTFETMERLVEGFVKWDGCSHFYFGEGADNPGYIHLCGARCFDALAWTLRETFTIAAREIPHWYSECAGSLSAPSSGGPPPGTGA